MAFEWKQTSVIPMFIDDGETEHEYRLTFATMTSYAAGKFEMQRLRIRDWLTDEFGEYSKIEDEAKEDFNILYTLMIKLAGAIAAIEKVERKEGDDWADAELPEEWRDIQAFAKSSPAGLIDDLFYAAVQAGNALRVFGLQPFGDVEKKMIRVHATRLED